LIGVGQPTSYDRLYKSLQQAEKASSVKSCKSKIVFEDELRLDLLMNDVKNETKELFVERTIAPIMKDEILFETLKVWIENNMSNQKASEQLYIHKNTIQYRLKKIEELTNLKLNQLHDLVLLYVGYRLIVE
jgi:carbohydrate diacid regulator